MACFHLISILQYLLLQSSLARASVAPVVIQAPPSSISTPSAVITGSSSSTSMAGPTIYVNSSESSLWYNNNSINMTLNGTSDQSKIRVVLSRQRRTIGFVCGFYCVESCKYYHFVVAVVGGGDVAVVWSANRGHPVQENATLELTSHGGMVLKDSDGTVVWSTSTSGKPVQGMNITEDGNMVLFNDETGVVWQSFDYPTDSLLTGQRLGDGQKLISVSSKTKWSRGSYFATLKPATGFSAYTAVGNGQPQMYYQLALNRSLINSKGPNYAELRRGAFVVNSGESQENFVTFPISFPFDSFVEYVKLDSDGHLKIYQHGDARGLTVLADMVTQDLGVCQHPRSCGPYGVCKEGQCSCPVDVDGVQYFKQTQLQLPDQGCSRITPLSCPPSPDRHLLVQVRNSTYFNIIDSDVASASITDIEECRQACLQNCSCGAFIFKYDNSGSGGHCYMPTEVLSFREEPIPSYGFSSVTYIKVQVPFQTPTPSASPTPRNRKNLTGIITGSSVGGFIVAAVVIVIFIRILRKKEGYGEDPNMFRFPGTLARFSYEELRLATKDFQEKLGAGGFGTVFKGKLEDGTSVAVKRLDRVSHGLKEFFAEVESIGNIHHFNLTRLIGLCADLSHKLLVYEYMSNGSLDNWIYHGGKKNCLDWQTRKKIILDIAKGLAYLHEDCQQRIAHLDIKPQNILLDENFNAKISDFGMSKLIDRDESQVHTNMRGTPGYIAPEWRQLKITVKVDTYSFGIVILEIVCGRKIFDQTRSESSSHLLGLLEEKAEEGRLIDIVDNMDRDMQGNREEVARMIKVGVWCLQDDYRRRPSMSTLMKVMEGVMEVDPNIIYRFTQSMSNLTAGNELVSAPPQASVLSNPR